MNWLTNFVRPKIRAIVGKADVPEHLWIKCSSCGQLLHHKALKEAMNVCSSCDHHMRIGPVERFEALFDDGHYTTIELPEVVADPLKFKDDRKYVDKLKESRSKTEQDDAVMVAHGEVNAVQTVIAVQNFAFMGGSLGLAAGEAILSAARLAIYQEAPLIIFAAAGGARMQEGILSLMQMPRTTIAVQMLREKHLPFISVLTDPTTGGVTASYAMLGDIAIAEPDALIGFTGPRVIESTIRERLPEGFQRAEYLLEHGTLDMVVHRHRLRETLGRILDLLTNQRAPAEIVPLPQKEGDIGPTAADQATKDEPTISDTAEKDGGGETAGADDRNKSE